MLPKIRAISFGLILFFAGTGEVLPQSLTHILDTVLYNDKPFSGTIHIMWQGLSQVSDTPQMWGTIGDGHIDMLIPPSETFGPASDYFVSYSPENGTPWTEIWVVPTSTSPLTISQVRTSSSLNLPQSTSPSYATLPISINEVSNLSADLAMINSQITPLGSLNSSGIGINTIVATLSTNVATLTAQVASLSATISGLSGSNGNPIATMPAFVDAEVPVGKIDGKNLSFILANQPNPPTSLVIFKNGVRLLCRVNYTLAGNTITFANTTDTPHVGDSLIVMYRF